MLDEADEMLSRGFKDQIYDVFRYMSNKIQVSSMADWLIVQPSLAQSSPIKGWWHHKQIATKGFMVDSSSEHVCEHK